MNYNPAVSFNGARNQVLQGQHTTAPTNPALFFAAVRRVAGGVGFSNPLSLAPAGAPGISYNTNTFGIDGFGVFCSPTTNIANKIGVVRADYSSTSSPAGAFTAFNGTAFSPCAQNPNPVYPANGIFQVGGRTHGNQPTRVFNGLIAEVIHFNSNTITAAQVQQVESYLAIKYGSTLSTNYLNTASTIIYDVSTYNYDIIGIGRDDNSGLLQKQSHTENDTTRIYLSTLASTNIDNSGSFAADNSYLLVGSNDRSMGNSGSTEFPSGGDDNIVSRIDREWKITNTSLTEDFSMDFKLSSDSITSDNLRILVDDDGDFSNAAVYANGDNGITISNSGSTVTVSGMNSNLFPAGSTKYITLAAITTTALPVEFASISAFLKSGNLDVNWTTASETNNDYFEIEASKDGRQFSKIGEVKSKANNGNASLPINYNYTKAIAGSAIMGLAFLGLIFGGVFKNRNRMAMIFAAFALTATIYACSKSKDASAGDTDQLFVRIVQVDKDGSRTYSKVIKVVNQ